LTVSQKAALSLLISVILIAGFSVLAFTGFFDLVESRFYNPSVTNSLSNEVNRDAETIRNFFAELEERFQTSMENDVVQRSFLPNQSSQDIFERTRLFGLLIESQSGLQSVRFVDAGGLRIHFSTSSADIIRQDNETISYRNYNETTPFIPYDELAVPARGEPKLTLDQRNDRIVFSFPFYDSMEIYRGTAFYYLSVRAVTERLISEGRLKIGEDISLISVPPGIVSGLPSSGRAEILPIISSIWDEGLLSMTTLDSGNSTSSLVLISAKTGDGLIAGRVVDRKLFEFPLAMKLILLVSLFLTVYLTIFLFFNLRPDTMTVIQSRLKGLELSLIREYYERKGEMDWNHWYRELESRREEVRNELKRGIKKKNASEIMADIDTLIDKSWDEILIAIGGRRETRLAIDEDKLQNILNRVLLSTGTPPVVSGAVVPAPVGTAVSPVPAGKAPDETEPEEALEVLDEAEPVEEAVEVLDEAEPVEEAAEVLDEAELVEEAAEVLDEAESVEEALEVLDEAEPVEEALEVLDEAPEPEAPPGFQAPDADTVGETPAVPAKKSNIRLVFGDDDIPYITESSGLELVDDLDEMMGNIQGPDGAEELENLEELDEDGLEELEGGESALEEGADSPESSARPQRGGNEGSPPEISEMPRGPVDIASQIEFGTEKETPEKTENIDGDFEIVSPFATMLSHIDSDEDFDAENEPEPANLKTSGKLEELSSDYSMSLVYKPFQAEEKSSPEVLQAMKDIPVIREQDGVNYVNEKIKTPDAEMEKKLDPGLRNLVDSVIKKKT
jgi:hypothetical protein